MSSRLVTHGLPIKGLMANLGGSSVLCLLAAPRVLLFDGAGNAEFTELWTGRRIEDGKNPNTSGVDCNYHR